MFIATAAVADWRVAQVATEKIKKDDKGKMPELTWVENPDILAEVAALERSQRGELFCVGFAAESHDLIAHAKAKRERKKIPLMVGNIGADTFGSDDNALWLIDAHGEVEWPRAPKLSLARRLMADIARRMTSS